MDTNAKLIWTNRALNVIAIIAGIGSAVMGALAALGDVVKTMQDAGLVPTRYVAIASFLAAVGLVAAKISKTPSQAMAAAIPPPKGGGTPGGPMVILMLALAAATLPSCKTTTTGPGPTSNPTITGVVDCALPSLFKVATFANLVPLVEHAIAQQDYVGALVSLASQYGQAEVDCIAAYLHDLGETQKAAAPHNEVVARRIDVTAQWLAREKAAGVEQVINWGAVQ